MSGEILDKLPKKTPAWAVGVTTVVVSTVVSLSAFYVVSKEEVKQALGWAEKHHEAQFTQDSKVYNDTLSSVLNLVRSNSEQIVQLSNALGATQQQNISLTDKVIQLEKRIDAVTGTLKECESKLKLCEGK